MSPSLFEQGVEVMLFGMGTVIAFLTLLVLAMGAMHWLLERFYPAPQEVASSASAPAASDRGATQAEVIAVITAAVHRHRQQASQTRMRQEDASHG